MLYREIQFVGVVLLIILGSSAVVAQPERQRLARPLMLPAERYKCLIRYADQLAVSARGNLVNISACPPKIEVGFTPPAELMKNYLILTPADLKCLLRTRQARHRVAFNRGQGRVAVYLRPCGARR